MNTASRMESTSMTGCIQVSQETANLLKEAGKEDWLTPRKSKIEAKGKGQLQTYFLNVSTQTPAYSNGTVGSYLPDQNIDPVASTQKTNRLAEWTFEVLAKLLKEMVIWRQVHGVEPEPRKYIEDIESAYNSKKSTSFVIEEVANTIVLPKYAQSKKYRQTASQVDLGESVTGELRCYVQTIASLYNDNAFHNFDHANHVVMSVNKLLSRIIAPDLADLTDKSLHDHTYGITSDPLTQFACIFSALIHDVDHSGAPNAQLVKEEAVIAKCTRASQWPSRILLI